MIKLNKLTDEQWEIIQESILKLLEGKITVDNLKELGRHFEDETEHRYVAYLDLHPRLVCALWFQEGDECPAFGGGANLKDLNSGKN